MMDFNQILLFAGLGLLVLVILFALWGFLGGLKRELKCIAVFIVLLVLFWLVFGDEATLLNAKYGQSIAKAMNINDNSITTVWDAILAYARLNIPNGKVLLVEGKETYNLIYSIASCVATLVLLISCTLVVVIITPILCCGFLLSTCYRFDSRYYCGSGYLPNNKINYTYYWLNH